MKRTIRTITIILLCGIFSTPTLLAQRHKGANNTESRYEQRSSSSTSSSRSGLNSQKSTRKESNSNTTRRKDNATDKATNISSDKRESTSKRSGFNSNNNNSHKTSPNGNRHNGSSSNINHNNNRHNGDHKANVANHTPHHQTAPQSKHRPYTPPMVRPHHRPTPPAGWRPTHRLPIIRSVLGLTFGTAINLSLDYLLDNGYRVDSYTNDVIYLRNIVALNLIWTDAALYYGSVGLDASSFYYSTSGYDLARYNNAYKALVASYGNPVTISNNINDMSATWFGDNNCYITLSFGQSTVNNHHRYLTTLTFGI